MKTIDTRVSSLKPGEDEVQLVEMDTGRSTTGSNCGVHKAPSEAEATYKAQHQGVLPREW